MKTPVLRTYTLLCLMLIAALGIVVLYFPKGELHLLLCDHHTPFGDRFFPLFTTIGEWGPYVLAALLLIFVRWQWAALLLTSAWISGLVAQLCKHIFCTPRPITWFAQNMPDTTLPLTDGYPMAEWFSFPSGHTTTFFTMMMVICYIVGQRHPHAHWVAVLTFLLAATGAYSRIYLSMHFPIDILGGMFIGITVTGIWLHYGPVLLNRVYKKRANK